MIEVALLLALIVFFLHWTTLEGNIFQGVRFSLWNLTPIIRKPLFDCPACMTPWWGSILILLGHLFNGWPLLPAFEWAVVILAAGGINVILATFIDHPDGNIKNP